MKLRISFVGPGFSRLAVLASLIGLAGCSTTRRTPGNVLAPISSAKIPEGTAPGTTGPTLHLLDGRSESPPNPIATFMYFVPLISPEPVKAAESLGNSQCTRVISATRRVTSDSFSVNCEFEITGEGFQRNTFDSTNQIRRHERRLKEGGVLERQLDYIAVGGGGRGRIEVEGAISNRAPVVTEVRLRFSDKGRPSPVTIGLRDIRFTDGEFCAGNEVVARVNTLTFRKAAPSKMEVSVGSVRRKDAGDGLWQKFVGGVTGVAANMFLKPITVDKAGHAAMLDFGAALASREASFTFPLAKNLKSGP